MIPGIRQRQVAARDGTRIGYQVRGEGPCVVLANGLGGTYVTWKYLYEALEGYRTICWDYRGLFTSCAPADRRANTVVHQVDDLISILDAEQVNDFVIVGWSAGVQVALETLRHHPTRVRGIYAINGTCGGTFHSVLGSRIVGRTIPALLRLVGAQSERVGRVSRWLADSSALIPAMQRLGLVSATIDTDLFREVAGSFLAVDWRIYADLLRRLDEHDAEDVLPSIDVPVAIATGDRDRLIPRAAAEHMHRRIRGSRFVVIAGGTHYMPVEYPALLIEELVRWLDRVPGWRRNDAAPGESRGEPDRVVRASRTEAAR
jgi:pimeloyl-ACP methyl ester carboxylesterase